MFSLDPTRAMFIIPTLIALGFLWWNGNLAWMCWTVVGVGVFSWLCGKSMLNARNDLQRGVAHDPKVFRFWELVASLTIWAHWIVCIAAIVLAFVVKRA